MTNLRTLDTAMKLDAAVTAANAVVYIGAAAVLDDVLGLSAGLLRGVGLFLAAYAVFVWAAGTRVPRAVIGLNLVWALDSLVVAAIGWGTPTAAGRAWIVAQGLAVAGLAALQATAARRPVLAAR